MLRKRKAAIFCKHASLCKRFVIEAKYFNAENVSGIIQIGGDPPVVPDVKRAGDFAKTIRDVARIRFEINAHAQRFCHVFPLLRQSAHATVMTIPFVPTVTRIR